MPIKTRAVQIWEFCLPRAGGDGIAGLLPGSARPVREIGVNLPCVPPGGGSRFGYGASRKGGYRSVTKVTA